MILTVTVPDTLLPYLTAAAEATGQPDLESAVTAHLAGLIRDSAHRTITGAAMQSVTDQVTQDMAAVDAQNALIAVSTSEE